MTPPSGNLSSFGRRLVVMAAVVSFAAGAAAQRSAMPADGSLPPALVATFDGTHAAVMDLEPSGSVDASVVVTFVNASSPFSVRMRWSASKDIGGQVVEAPPVDKTETVSFMPTAVCQASDSNNTLFVAGWYKRTKSCVVEKWTFGLGAFGVTLNPVTGVYTGTFSPPVVDREVIYLSDAGIAAVEALAYHPLSETLLLLEEGPEANIHSLTLAGELAELADIALLPDLVAMKHVRFGAHTNMAYGFFLVSERAWSASYATRFLVLPDFNGDGILELGNSLSLDQEGVAIAFPATGWVAVD